MSLAQELRPILAQVKNEKYVVYKITNKTNNKVYIGKTIRSMSGRFAGHNHKIRQGSQLPIYNAIRKYGWADFTIEILARCSAVEELNVLEISWIKHYNARDIQFGYNIAEGGDSGFPFSEKIIKNLAVCRKGVPLSATHKQRISEGTKGAQLGKVVSENTRKLLSEQRLGIPLWDDEQKKQMSLDMTGAGNNNFKAVDKKDILNCFQQSMSIKQMEVALGISYTTISRKINEMFGITADDLRKSISGKSVNQKLSDLDVEEIRVKSSQGIRNYILAEEYGVSKSLIGLIVNGKTRT